MAGPRVTKGDAEALLEAFGSGGAAVFRHGSVTQRIPPLGGPDVRAEIRPFSPSDGLHLCVLDWHTILLADFEGGDRSFKQTDAQAIVDGLDVVLTLDGAALPVSRTAIKRFNDPGFFGLEVAYYAQWGRVMTPNDLAVGAHTLSVVISSPEGPFTPPPITFFIDPAGTGACQ